MWKSTSPRLVGTLFILLSALAFGVLPLFTHYIYAAGADTRTVLILRFSIAGAVMVGVMLARNETWPRGRALLGLIAMGAIGYAGQSFCYFTALHYASAGLVALLLYLYPILVTLLAVILLKDKMTRPKLIALALASAGLVMTIGPALDGSLLGIGLGLLAAIIYSLYVIAGSRLTVGASPMASATVIMLSAATTFSLSMVNGEPAWPTGMVGWSAMVMLALISTVVAIVTFFAGLTRLGPSESSMLSTFEPVVSVAGAAWLLGDQMSIWQWFGGGLILASALLLARSGTAQAAD
ncbi:drug/metabolite transporter (DMT)-like permease [Chitinivorax tropicus]|uniref:Drug/metabolite transporter (DMT)-like permease n=1 Tax=Chitinivorax tropicus TaxID=714531 RepID=A0A840MRL7_9PROT|nr:EamA family transporter [Chitinivorax tropicus]MBB5020065.1 drug/metabolite transporter (DMT)-like permease [Chitinivorax tropicus]